MFCAVRCVIVTCFSWLFSNYSTYVLLICFVCLYFVLFVSLFPILCILCFCTLLCIVSLSVYGCLSPITVQFYRPLAPGGNPIAVNKYIIRAEYCKPREGRSHFSRIRKYPAIHPVMNILSKPPGMFSSFRILYHLKYVRQAVLSWEQTLFMIPPLIHTVYDSPSPHPHFVQL